METVRGRVVTLLSRNNYVFRNRIDASLSGICVDLWKRTARDLRLPYSVEVVNSWVEMYASFRDNKSDLILQRMDEGHMIAWNITE